MQVKELYTDERLIAALKNDEAGAFQTLYKRYWKDLYKTAYARFQNEHDAEDAVQELFIKVYEIRHNLQITTSLIGYLQNALKFRIIRTLSRADLHEKAMEHLVYRMTEMQATILDVMDAADLQKTISKVISSFPVNMQQIFILRGEDYTVKEIAEALGLAEQTVRNNIAESLRRLKFNLEREHPEISGTVFTLLAYLLLKK